MSEEDEACIHTQAHIARMHACTHPSRNAGDYTGKSIRAHAWEYGIRSQGGCPGNVRGG